MSRLYFFVSAALLISSVGAMAAEQAPITAISQGGAVFLRADGTVWTSLGSNSVVNSVRIHGLPPIQKISGYSALGVDGSVWQWKMKCQVKDEAFANCHPADIHRIASISDVVQISEGWGFTIALKKNGTVWGWGDGSLGQLGDTADQLKMTLTDRDRLPRLHRSGVVKTASQIPIVSHISHIAAGFQSVVAVDQSGQVWSWGFNGGVDIDADPTDVQGSLGPGDFVSENGIGVIKVRGLPKIRDAVTSSERTFVVAEDGSVFAWGIVSWRAMNDVRYGSMTPEIVPTVKDPAFATADSGGLFWTRADGQGMQCGPVYSPSIKPNVSDDCHELKVEGPVRDISHVFGHLAILTKDGKMWTSSENPTGGNVFETTR